MEGNIEGKRIAFVGPGTAKLESYRLPALGSDEVLVRTLYTVLSAGTEKAFLLGESNTGGPFPRYLGYSACARVEACGDAVKSLKVGQRVIVYHGGHQTHTIQKESALHPVHKGVDSLDAAMVVIASMGLQGVRKSRLELGESGLVLGLGLLGLFAVQTMKAAGGSPVIAVDFSGKRLDLAMELGTQYGFSPEDPQLAQKVREVTRGRGANAVVEVTGSESALPLALKLASERGRIVLAGCTRQSTQPIDFYQLVHKPGVSIIGGHNYIRPDMDSSPGYWTRADDYRTLMDLILDGRVRVKPMISQVVPPEDCEAVYNRLARDRDFPLGTVFDWNKLS